MHEVRVPVSRWVAKACDGLEWNAEAVRGYDRILGVGEAITKDCQAHDSRAAPPPNFAIFRSIPPFFFTLAFENPKGTGKPRSQVHAILACPDEPNSRSVSCSPHCPKKSADESAKI